MRKNRVRHYEGETKIVTRFLFWPKTLPASGEHKVSRWLEIASWRKIYLGDDLRNFWAGWLDQWWTDI